MFRYRMSMVVALALAAACHRAPQVTTLGLPAGAPGTQQGDPALAVDPATGDLLFAWMSGDSAGSAIYFARSADGGATWSAPSVVAAASHQIHPHGEASPKIVATDHGVVALVWASSFPVTGREWPAANIQFARSTDSGRTWSAPVRLNDDSASAPISHTFHGAAWQGDSGVVVAWLDERQVPAAMEAGHEGHGSTMVAHEHEANGGEENATLFLAESGDLGASWHRSNRALWNEVCPCCRVTMARAPGGRVVAAWRHVQPGNVRDVVVAPLDSAGHAAPTPVHADNWVYPGCPHTGPGVSVDGSGATHVAWYSGKEGAAGIFYARAPQTGMGTFSEPVAIVSGRTLPASHTAVAARQDGGAYVAYDVTDDGHHAPSLALIDATGKLVSRVALGGSDGADHPQVVSLKTGAAIVAWVQMGDAPSIRLVRVAPPS